MIFVYDMTGDISDVSDGQNNTPNRNRKKMITICWNIYKKQ